MPKTIGSILILKPENYTHIFTIYVLLQVTLHQKLTIINMLPDYILLFHTKIMIILPNFFEISQTYFHTFM